MAQGQLVKSRNGQLARPCVTGDGNPAEPADDYCIQCQLNGTAPDLHTTDADYDPKRGGRKPKAISDGSCPPQLPLFDERSVSPPERLSDDTPVSPPGCSSSDRPPMQRLRCGCGGLTIGRPGVRMPATCGFCGKALTP